MKTADLYIRVSTDEQADKGYSQRSQEEVLRKYCNINQLQVGRVIFEDHSAKTFNRPEWTHLLLDLKKRKSKTDLILFTKWDRFSRNAGDAYQMISVLRKLGIEPQAIEQPLDLAIPENKMMLAFYLAAPEVENDRRALNVTFGMRRARKEGRWMGPAPFGYVNKITELGRKYIEPKYPEAAIVKWVFDEVLKRRQSVRSIWRDARKKGLRCCKNNLWTIIRNPVYCGKIFVSKYKDEDNVFVQGQHEGIVTERLFQEVQDVLDNKHRIYKSKKDSGDFQLRSHLLCPACGKILTGSTSRGATKRYTYYHCISPCKTRFRTEEANERFLVELKKYVPGAHIAELFVKVCDDLLKQRTKGQREDLQAIRQELEKESSRLAKARDLLLNSDLEPAEYKTIKAASEINIAKLERKLFDSGRPDPKTGELSNKVFRALSGMDRLFMKGDVKLKNQVISSIFPEKLIFDGTHYRTTRVNEAVELIYKLGKGFNENKNGQTDEIFDLSTKVNRIGFENIHFILFSFRNFIDFSFKIKKGTVFIPKSPQCPLPFSCYKSCLLSLILLYLLLTSYHISLQYLRSFLLSFLQ